VNWKSALKSFDQRVAAIEDYRLLSSELIRDLPSAPLSEPLDREGYFRWHSSVYAHWTLRAIDSLRISWIAGWHRGDLLSCAILTRAILETHGALEFLSKECVQRFSEKPGDEVAFDRLERLIKGTNSPVPLPLGGHTSAEPIHVMDFVRSSTFLPDYEWLCDAAHPSFYARYYWLASGGSDDNWSNDVFAEFARKEIERLLTLIEKLLYKSDATAKELIEEAARYFRQT
jgi:hypothetical protein